MTILEGDIKLLASRVMDDVPEGGGGPTGAVIPYGGSNHIFRDITESDRAGGNVSIMQVHAAVMTANAEPYMGANFILSMPPTDPSVSVTLAKCSLFARRTEIATAIANYLIQGPEWSGYLLENHVAGQRSLQILHRPGTPAPPIGRTLVLLHNEGQPGALVQYVRVTRVATEQRTFTYQLNDGQYVDFAASVSQVDLSDALRHAFPGSPPDRGFARNPSKTLIRDTTVADAATYYGASPTVLAGALGDTVVRVASIYTQVVPNARTETIALDQRPAAQRLLQLATSPRLVQVPNTPHTLRIRVGQENRGFSWVQMLKPFPAPNTVVVSYMAMGVWYTVTDDGQGALTGAGAGTVNYANGSIALTTPALPDAGSAIVFNWGESSAYTNRSGQAGYRAPEFAWAMPHQGIKSGSVVVTWMSGGALKTATDNGTGGFTGHAAGEVDYATGKIYLRPTAMIDAGGEFSTAYEYASTRTENFAAPAPDAGGFASLTLAEVPAARSVTVRWITTRTVSASSGSSEIVSTTGTDVLTPPVTVAPAEPQTPGNMLTASTPYTMPGQTVQFYLTVAAPQTPGTYTWSIEATTPTGVAVDAALVLGGASSGTFAVTAPAQQLGAGGPMATPPVGVGSFSLLIDADCPDLLFTVRVANQALTMVAAAPAVQVDALGAQPAPAWPATVPPPVIVAPTDSAPQLLPMMAYAGLTEAGARVYVKALPRNVAVFGATYDPPEVNALVPIVWTAGDLAAKEKLITSQSGVPVYYQLWG